MLKDLLQRITVRSIVVLLLVCGTFILAFVDSSFRPVFADLAKVAIGGYFGQMIPRRTPSISNLKL